HQYQAGSYRQHLRDQGSNHKELPNVYLVVLYNGARKWKAKPDIKSLIGGKGAVQAATRAQAAEPGFDLVHTKDLAALLDDHPKAQAGQAALTAGGRRNISARALQALLRALPDKSEFEYLTIRYIVQQCTAHLDEAQRKIQVGKMRAAIQKVKGERGLKMMEELRGTFWEQVADENKAEGEAKGKVEGKAETLTNLLRRKFGSVSVDARRRVKQASLAELDAWLDAIITASSLDEVFAAKPRSS
ncbi:MAG: hypothetical protein ACR2PJ_01205, partial [Pseudomonadales bacterium]